MMICLVYFSSVYYRITCLNFSNSSTACLSQFSILIFQFLLSIWTTRFKINSETNVRFVIW